MNSITSREGIKEFQGWNPQIACLRGVFSIDNWLNSSLPFLGESCYNKRANKESNP
jgi:hypothetical protein